MGPDGAPRVLFSACKGESHTPSAGFKALFRRLRGRWRTEKLGGGRGGDGVTPQALAGAQVLVFGAPRELFTRAELQAVRGFLRRGGSLLVLGGEGGEKRLGTNLNQVLEEFGIRINADCVVRTGSLRPAQAWALSMVVIPPATVLLWVVAFSALAKCNRRHKFLQVHLPVATLVTLLMAHPVITKAALKLLACRPVAGRSFLEADMNVDCASDEYRQWSQSLGLPMLFAFTLGIPGCYALAMWRHVRRGRLAERRAVYGFLFSGFREDRWWFELWNTLRKSLFTMGAVVFGPFGTSMQTWAALVLLLLFVVVFSLSEPVSARVLNCVYVRPLFFRLYVQGSPPPHTPLPVCIVLCSTSTRG